MAPSATTTTMSTPPPANITGNGNGTSNGHTSPPALTPGIYVPTLAFFTPSPSPTSTTIDIPTTTTHALRLAHSGITGLVVHGSNGEAVHLTHAERSLITRTTRAALDSAGFVSMPLIVGCGAQSTQETISLCKQAKQDGGSHVLVLPPSYYSGLLGTEEIVEHFRMVAGESPLPVVVYNFPGACSGLDLSSDAVLEIAGHENVVGVKLTCGNTGKLARVVAGTKKTKGASKEFVTFGGSADFLVQTLAVGGHGVIAGTANIAPKLCVKLMRLWEEGRYEEARALQEVLARGDWTAIQGGFVSVKVALNKYYGYGGEPRRPCVLPTGEKLRRQEQGFRELVEMEMTEP